MSILPGFLTRNWRLKLAAFGLAVFLWAAVRAEPDRTNTRTITGVPVLIEAGDLDWTTAGPPQPPTVDVRVGGAFGMFGAIDRQVTVQVPVDRVTSRDTVIELRRDWVRSGNGSSFSVQDISPPRVRVSFERTEEAAVPISLRTEGSLPENLALAQPLSVYPGVVRVRGRESRVAELDSVESAPLDLGSLGESGSYRVSLDTTGFGDLTFRTTEATVEVRVEEAVEQTFAGIPIGLDSLVEGIDSAAVVTRPATVQVTLRGGRTRVAQADPDALAAVVPARVVEALRPGEQRVVPVRILGVPELVLGFSSADSVRVVRLDGRVPPAADDSVTPDTSAAPDTTGVAGRAGAERSGS